jgi:hypothetical protein
MEIKEGDLVTAKDGVIRKIVAIQDSGTSKVIEWVSIKNRNDMGVTLHSYFIKSIRDFD